MSENFGALEPTPAIDVSFLFDPAGAKPVKIQIDDQMYTVKTEPSANWVWHAFRGFRRLKSRSDTDNRKIEVFATIGSGNGIDAIGAAQTFKDLRTIVVTDSEKKLVDTAVKNVISNVRNGIEVIGLTGDVCIPLLERGIKADLIYANLPTIPTTSQGPIDHGTFYRPHTPLMKSSNLERYLLGLQRDFLVSARNALTSSGEVAFMIGGRFPLEVLDELAIAGEFTLREVIAAFKVQTEAEDVTLGYSKREGDGIRFHFYDASATNMSDFIHNEGSGQELKTKLAPLLMSATDALKHVRAGLHVGHTVHMMAGHPI